MNLTNTSKFNSFKLSNNKNRNIEVIPNEKFSTEIDLVKVKKNNFENYKNLQLDKNFYTDNREENHESLNYLHTTASSNKPFTPKKFSSSTPRKNKPDIMTNNSNFNMKKTFLLNKTSNISIESNPIVIENLRRHFDTPEDYLNEDFENFIIVGKKSYKPRLKDVMLKNANIQKNNKILESKNLKSSAKMVSRTNSKMNTLIEEKQNANSSIKSFLKPNFEKMNTNDERSFSPNPLKVSRTNSVSSSNKNMTNSFIKRGDNHRETKKNFLFSTKNVKEEKNFIVVDDKTINEYFKDLIDKKDNTKINIAKEELGHNCFAKNKSEIKRILKNQEHILNSKDKKALNYSNMASVITKKINRENLIMETSIEQFRLKKEMIEKRDSDLNSSNMGCTNQWVTKLREYEINNESFNNMRINAFNNNHKIKKSKIEQKGKNLKYTSLIDETSNLNSNLPTIGNNKNNFKDQKDNTAEEYNLTLNGTKIDSKTPVPLNFKQYKTVNFGSNKCPIYASVIENKEKLEKEKVMYFGNKTENNENHNNHNQVNYVQLDNMSENNKYKYISLNNRTNYTNFLKTNYFGSTSGSKFEINNVENPKNSDLKTLKTQYEEMFLQTINCLTNNNTQSSFNIKDNLQFKLNKRNQRFLCKVDEKIIQNTCSNIHSKIINVDNINVDSKMIFELQTRKNNSLYTDLMVEEEKINQKLTDLTLKGVNLALVEKENALKIPGKKVLYKNAYKGMFDEEVLLCDFDKIIK